MKKYLLAIFLSVLSLWSFAQGDIPIKSDVVPPSVDFLRPILRPSVGEIEYRKADGTYWNGRLKRDPKLFYTWPPYLINNPILGDQAIGPSLTADTSQRQFAIFNGNRWIEYGGKATELTFGSAFTKTGTTVNLAQYPNSIGDILADYLSFKYAPNKPVNPLQHTFMLYNPTTGRLEGMPYADVVSAMGVVQWPGTLGKIGVDELHWSTLPPLISASNLDLMNARFLMTFGSDNYRMSMGEYMALITQRLSGSTSVKSLRRIAPVKNHLEPGQVGDYFWYKKKMHLNIEKEAGKNMWIAWAPDTTFNYDVVPSTIPAPVIRYTGNPNATSQSLAWFWDGGEVNNFRVYQSKGDTAHYVVLSPDAAAGERAYTITNLAPSTTYYYRLVALTPQGQSPLSNTVSGTTPAVDNFTVWPNIKNLVVTQNGPTQAKLEFDITEYGGGVSFYISRQNAPDVVKDELWEFAAGMELYAPGHYTMFIDNINDSDFRYLRYRRNSTTSDGKQPSSWERYGPFNMTGVIKVNTPAITSVSNITSSSLTLGLNFNNSSISRAFLYIAEWKAASGQISYDRIDIPTTISTYQVTNLKAGTKYLFHLQVAKKEGSNEVYSPNSSPETEATTQAGSSDIATPTILEMSRTSSVQTPEQYGQVSYTPVSTSSIPAAWDYRIGNDAWAVGGDGVVSNFFKFVLNEFTPNTTYRFRVRFKRLSDGKYGLYSNVLKMVTGPNFGKEVQPFSDFTTSLEAADQTPNGQAPVTTQPVQLSLSNTSSSSTTITVTNHGSGTKNYSWAVYQGEFNNGGEWKRCAENNIPSTGTFTVDISSCNLTPGVTYRMYVTETANADAKRNYIEFTVSAQPPVSESRGTMKARSYTTSN
ncbi:hypothetical protein BWI96_16795 [Siphonobacter sp. SORGH_AS_0500]|uniref:fibronectin type III domain-containing protein n=1 Tax=Siphonobacter sp. SORGH_AS_0500 TaxID=1864824 RepID=UPI000CACE8D1|nr:fibronectin type III domain-containing protein [Siphonobacter sp. SORGH_AS_0500]PKK35557.1 hypothetical protein BWI96_16795 [Siphonobacter sp. SORGH_AS_0500]